ncbi:copper chaperone PCu(A)C [Cupriavidus sp. 2SB]|uniref:copper chaperone PCu(A)C n=1 Tax=unclassified Cupriavidus TaxID=2640874 RepID=UPI0010FA0A30|nr:copper chaperone PCu(A)C [Cupriavidus sp. 2SB]
MQVRTRALRAASIVTLGVAGLLTSAQAMAQVDVSDAWVRGTVPAQTASGAFMTIHAHQGAKLVGVSSPLGSAELHEMKMDNNVMRMRPIESLDLPKMQNVQLKPGGYHVMLMGLKQQLKAGDSVPITLKIEQNGKVTEQTVKAQVRDVAAPAQSGGQMDHKH